MLQTTTIENYGVTYMVEAFKGCVIAARPRCFLQLSKHLLTSVADEDGILVLFIPMTHETALEFESHHRI